MSTGDTNGKVIDPEDVKCVKIPEEELTDFEKRKIETFEPPAQLGLPEVNEGIKTTIKPETTPKSTKAKPNKTEKPEKPEKPKTTEETTTTTEATTTTTTGGYK